MALIDDIQRAARQNAFGTSGQLNIETELANLFPSSPFVDKITDLERSGLDRIIAAGDPTANLAAAQRRFEVNTLPSITARRNAAGFGRTDPSAAIARSFAPSAEAIELQSLQNRISAGQSEINVGSNLATRRANMMDRALRILSQLQTLRTNQASINARSGGGVHLRNANRSAFRPSTGIPTVQNAVPFRENPLRQGRTDLQIQQQAQAQEQAALANLSRFTGGATSGGEAFGPTLPGGVRPGETIGGAGFGGTITLGGGPTAPRQVASVQPKKFSNLRDPFARPVF